MKSLMLMAICQKFEFPPPGMAEFHKYVAGCVCTRMGAVSSPDCGAAVVVGSCISQPATKPKRLFATKKPDVEGDVDKYLDFVRLPESELVKVSGSSVISAVAPQSD